MDTTTHEADYIILFSSPPVRVSKYTNEEEGVRNLKRCFENIISKINIFEILYSNGSKNTDIDLPYTFNDFTLPYTISEVDINNILLKHNNNNPPEHMYM